MSRNYLERVRRNILPLSRAQSLPAAFSEWRVDGSVTELGDKGICQLCEQEGLRWHFGIANDLTCGHLLVGSRCILRFDIATSEELAHILRTRRKRACLDALRSLAVRDGSWHSAVRSFDAEGSLPPREASWAFSLFKHYGITHDPTWFRVALKNRWHWAQLAQLSSDHVRHLWPALTKSQRQRARRIGHQGPSVMIGEGLKWPYEAWRAVGWSDANLIAHGHMRP